MYVHSQMSYPRFFIKWQEFCKFLANPGFRVESGDAGGSQRAASGNPRNFSSHGQTDSLRQGLNDLIWASPLPFWSTRNSGCYCFASTCQLPMAWWRKRKSSGWRLCSAPGSGYYQGAGVVATLVAECQAFPLLQEHLQVVQQHWLGGGWHHLKCRIVRVAVGLQICCK